MRIVRATVPIRLLALAVLLFLDLRQILRILILSIYQLYQIVSYLLVALVTLLQQFDLIRQHAIDEGVAGCFLLFEFLPIQPLIIILIIRLLF